MWFNGFHRRKHPQIVSETGFTEYKASELLYVLQSVVYRLEETLENLDLDHCGDVVSSRRSHVSLQIHVLIADTLAEVFFIEIFLEERNKPLNTPHYSPIYCQ